MLGIWVLLLSLCATAIGAPPKPSPEEPCKAHDGPRFFDLSSLRSKKSDYAVISEFGAGSDSGSARNISLNVCGPVVGETWKLEEPEKVGAFFTGDHHDYSIGQVNTTLVIKNGHPLLIYTGGSPCPGLANMKRSSAIRFVCDANVFATGSPKLVAQLPLDDDEACSYFFEWRTHVACPTAKPGGGGPLTVFVTIIFIAFLAYICAATFYNRMVLGLRGWDQLPRLSFFSLSDTRDFLDRCRRGTARRRGGSTGRAGYSTLSGVSHQPPTWGSWRAGGPGGVEAQHAHEEEEGDPIEVADERFSLDIDGDDEGARDNQPLTSGIPPSFSQSQGTPPPPHVLPPGDGVIKL